MTNKIEELIADYFDNQLSAKQLQELEEYFAKNRDESQEFEEMKITFLSIQKPVEHDFDLSKDRQFYEFLSKEKKKNNRVITLFQQPFFRYAAGFAGILFAFWIGRQSIDNQVVIKENIPDIKPKIQYIERIVEVPVVKTETKYIVQNQAKISNKQSLPNVMDEIGNLKKEMQETKDLLILSMLKRESASERIQAVNYSYDLQKPDDEVLKALIYTLDYDRNVNVRMAAADAIGRFGNDENVRNALIKSLLKQQEPTLQISIIELLTRFNERRALPAFRLLVEDDSVSPFVREKAQEGTKVLSL